MADAKVLKPKTFRIDDATADKIRELSEIIGGNQQETFSKLIEAYEFQSSKAVLTGQKEDIGQFERYVNALTRMYMSSLEANQTMKETVRTEFDAVLKSKDDGIQKLQKQLSEAGKAKKAAEEKAEACQEENAGLRSDLKSMEKDYRSKLSDLQEMLADKEQLNKTLMDSVGDVKQKNASLSEEIRELKQERDSLLKGKEEYSLLSSEYERLKKQKGHLEEELARVKEAKEREINDLKQREKERTEQARQQFSVTLERTVLELERKYQTQMQEREEENEAKIDKYQQKYFALLERLQEKETKP